MSKRIRQLMAEKLAKMADETKGVRKKRALRKRARMFRQLAKADKTP